MRIEWKTYKIAEVGRVITGKTPSTLNTENFGAKYPFITPKDMVGRKKIFQTERYLSEEGKNTVKNCLLPPNSVCVSCIGSDMGKVVMTTKSSVTNQQLNSIVCNHMFDSDFIYYAVTNISESLKNAGHHSTAVPILNKTDFSNFEIYAPDRHIQRRIASILSALDDKIELNYQTNATLEGIAQALFKEWFVDFNFPHSPLEGWQAKPDGVDSSLRPCPTGRVDSLQAHPDSLPSWQKNSLFPFWTLPKNHKLQERAKELRKQGILSEVVFWKAFKDKKKLGWDIDRQVIIGNFIVDFFIPELGLVFEIDGSSHNDKQEYDQERDAFLSSLQLKVARISDKDVLRNIEGVWSFVTESIRDRVEELEDKNPPRPEELGDKTPPRPSGTPQEGKKYKDDGGEMQDSELGPIPKGWRVGKLGDVCKNSRNTIHPKEIKSDTAYVGLEHISRKSLGLISWGVSGEVDSQKTHFKKYDVLFGKLRPYFHKVCISPLDGICSTDILVIEPQKNGLFSFCLNHLFSDVLITYVSSIADGTRMPRVDWNSISNYEIVLPPENLVLQFNNTTFPFYDEIIENNQQSATLAAIRDALLPKLMNGEINV